MYTRYARGGTACLKGPRSKPLVHSSQKTGIEQRHEKQKCTQSGQSRISFGEPHSIQLLKAKTRAPRAENVAPRGQSPVKSALVRPEHLWNPLKR